MEDAFSAINAAHDDAAKKNLGAVSSEHPERKGGRSELKCPICPEGTLRYSVAGINGHMHAACTTEGCIRWME